MRISVALSTYNGSRFLRQQLQSLEDQTLRPDELVVRDDASDDETRRILEEFAARASFRVELELGSRRLGSTPSFERVLERCTGDIIALCDQDDVWRSDKLEVIHRTFSERAAVGLVFTNAALIDGAGAPLRHNVWDVFPFDANGRWMLRRNVLAFMLTRFSAPGCTIAYRAEHQPVVLPFPPILRSQDPPMHHDRWILTMVAAVADVLPLQDCLVSYRLHADQQIGLGRFFDARSTGSRRWNVYRARLKWGDMVRELGQILATVPIVRQCLVEQRPVPSAAQAVVLLDEFVEHLEFRRRLPHARPRRAFAVGRAWVRGDYHRYANGMWSAVADVLRPCRRSESRSVDVGVARPEPAAQRALP
jgi:glycosyltransferase involved in cell wall biosynthesis